MPENFLYARCRVNACGKIFEGQLSWDGVPHINTSANDFENKSPIIDLLQNHHLETGILSRHNSFLLFTSLAHALKPPMEEADVSLTFAEYPLAVGVIGVSRQRNVTLFLKTDPSACDKIDP